MNPQAFIDKSSIFTKAEFKAAIQGERPRSDKTVSTLLDYYKSKGRILGVRRGVYVVVPRGVTPQKSPLDPYVLASKMADDAVLAYHSALEFFGKAYSVFHRFFYLTHHVARETTVREFQFQAVSFPKHLTAKGEENFGVQSAERAGVDLRVTSLERTLVDVLDRPQLGGGWEEIWRSLSSVEYFDLDQVVVYTQKLANKTTTAKVGFFLQEHQKTLMVEEKHLKLLRRNKPKQVHYLDRGHQGKQRLVKEWNLMVPDEILNRSWEEVS